jgi:putative transcriptional regulator
MKKSKILEAVHETALGLHRADVIDRVTVREFNVLCMQAVEPLEPSQIKRIREASNVSQAVFATYLNISVSTIQKWEIGNKKPNGSALKLLHIVEKRDLEAIAL